MNERRKIARAISETIEPAMTDLGAGPRFIEEAITESTDAVMSALEFEDED